MRKTFAVALKEFRQAWRDLLTLTMMLGVPACLLLLYGYALSFDVKHVALAVQDRSGTAESRDLVASFVRSEYFLLARALPPDADFHRLFQENRAQAVLVIPEDYARRLGSGRPGTGATAQVQLIVDGSNANTAAVLLGYVQGISGKAFVPTIHYEPRVWYNPELKSSQFLVPGLIAFIMMITAVLATALSIAREKERGTLEQLRVTSLSPAQLILGKTFPYLLISVVAMAIILVTARILFDVHIRGSLLDLSAATLLFLVGALGLGLLVSSIARSQAMAWQMGALLSMLPTIFLSGFIFPIRNMPPVLQGLTYLFPARYFLVILRGVILKGASLAPYLDQMVYLALYAAVVLAVAYKRLSRELGRA